MPDIESIENLLEEIELHEAPLTDSETEFLERVVDRFETKGTLDSDTIVLLYELLDKLDDRSGGGRDMAYAGVDDDEDIGSFSYSSAEEEE
jgi:hypothetical protein